MINMNGLLIDKNAISMEKHTSGLLIDKGGKYGDKHKRFVDE